MSGDVVRRGDMIALVRSLEDAPVLGPTFLDISKRPDLSLATFENLARFFGSVHDGSKWWISELILQAESRWGESAYQIAQATGRSERTLQNWVWVASRVARSQRREALSFTHHYLVAALPPADQTRWLDQAEAERWSSRELQDAIRSSSEIEPVHGAMQEERSDCDEIVEEAAASIREQLIACNHSTGIVVEITVVDGFIEYRVESRGEA